MGREVRKVPADWQHPKDARGRYIPLHGGSFAESAAEWDESTARWAKGERRNWGNDTWQPIEPEYVGMTYEEWSGPRPVASDYMPDWPADQRTHLMMYEDTSEGTPISPAFATPEELARWLADTGASAFGSMTASYEHWLHVCRGGWAPSAAVMDGRMMSGVEAMAATKP